MTLVLVDLIAAGRVSEKTSSGERASLRWLYICDEAGLSRSRFDCFTGGWKEKTSEPVRVPTM